VFKAKKKKKGKNEGKKKAMWPMRVLILQLF
jgi:hypothetical protein